MRDSRRPDEQQQRKVDKRVDHGKNQGSNPGPSNKDERLYTYDSIETVSYTHLDVYKRQKQFE